MRLRRSLILRAYALGASISHRCILPGAVALASRAGEADEEMVEAVRDLGGDNQRSAGLRRRFRRSVGHWLGHRAQLPGAIGVSASSTLSEHRSANVSAVYQVRQVGLLHADAGAACRRQFACDSAARCQFSKISIITRL